MIYHVLFDDITSNHNVLPCNATIHSNAATRRISGVGHGIEKVVVRLLGATIH